MAAVLIVDPDKNLRTMLESYLRGLGYIVDTAPGALEALEKLDHGQFGIVLADVTLGRGNGVSLLHEVRRRSPQMVLVMTTGWDGIPLALEALRDGAHDYLIKPLFSLAQVGLLVSQAARSSARQVTS